MTDIVTASGAHLSDALHAQLLAAIDGRTNPALRAVVELHKPKNRYAPDRPWWQCEGDEFSGYDGEPPDWPCETIVAIARALGGPGEDAGVTDILDLIDNATEQRSSGARAAAARRSTRTARRRPGA